MTIGSTISGCTVLGAAPAGDGESYILLLKQPGTRVQWVTGRVYVRQLPQPTEWWNGTYSDRLEDAVKHWVDRSCITNDDPTEAVKWLTRLIENTEKALA